MKRVFLTMLFIGSALIAVAQNTYPYPSTGSVGIGTTSPQTTLHVVSSGALIDETDQFAGGGLIIQGNPGSRSITKGAQLEFVIPANADGSNFWGQGRIVTVAGNTNGNDATGEMILGTRRHINKVGTGIDWYYGNDITIDGHGFIGINTLNTFGYQFAVNGSAIATSMTVKLYTAWPDYVFKPSYKLPALDALKAYIEENQHLPDMPVAAEVEKDGLDLGKMNAKLLKKVEELTLYLLEKDKQLKDQAEELKSQQEQINKLIQLTTAITQSMNKTGGQQSN